MYLHSFMGTYMLRVSSSSPLLTQINVCREKQGTLAMFKAEADLARLRFFVGKLKNKMATDIGKAYIDMVRSHRVLDDHQGLGRDLQPQEGGLCGGGLQRETGVARRVGFPARKLDGR